MESAYRQAIEDLKFALYDVYRAYIYYSLDDSLQFSVDDTNVASLTKARLNITKKYYDGLEAKGVCPTHFTIQVSIGQYLATGVLQSFAAGATALTFSIPTDAPEFAAISQALVSQIGVAFASGGTKLTEFTLNLTHHGHAVILDQNGGTHVFLHDPITVPYGVDLAGNETIHGDFGGSMSTPAGASSTCPGSQLYNGVSPYGPWTINLSTMDPNQRSKITSVTCSFTGQCYGRNASKQSALFSPTPIPKAAEPLPLAQLAD